MLQSPLQDYVQCLGEDHPKTLQATRQLAAILDSIDQSEAARKQLEFIATKTHETFGARHPITIQIDRDLINHYQRHHLLAKEELVSTKLLIVLMKTKGNSDPEVIALLTSIERCLAAQELFSKGKPF